MDEARQRGADGAAHSTLAGRPGRPVDPHRLRHAILERKRLIIGAAILGAIVGYVIAKVFVGHAFATTAILKYEGEPRVPGLPPTRHAIEPATEVLRNRAVLEKIRDESGFRGSLTALSARIGYEIDMLSDTIEVTVADTSAEGAAEYARLVTDVFMDYHKDRQARRLHAELASVRRRVDASEHESEVARQRYNDFRERHGIADLSTEQKFLIRSAGKYRADSEFAVADVRALEAEVASLEAELSNMPKTTFIGEGTSPERAAYNRLRQELASARATLSDDHPRVRSLEQQVQQLGAQAARGAGSRRQGVVGVNAGYQSVEAKLREAKSALAAAQARQSGLVEMAAKTAERVESFSDLEGQAASLLAEVEVNEALVGGLRRTEAAIEDALRDPPSGFVVLDPGAAPEYPMRDKTKVVVFGGTIFLSVALALLILLRSDIRKLAPVTPAEVAFWGNGPVVGATGWPEDPDGLEELVAGLDDLAPDATGTMLVLGISDGEFRPAVELTDRMGSDWFAEGDTAPEPIVAAPSPIVTPPPPSGPYPVGSAGTPSVALVRRPPAPSPHPLVLARRPQGLQLEVWEGPLDGQALRRAARLADRVVVLIRAGVTPAVRLYGINDRIGRKTGVGYIVIGLPAEFRNLPDRVGDVEGFWGVSGGRAR